jgi:hypothetical protein
MNVIGIICVINYFISNDRLTKINDDMLTGTIVDWKKDIKKLNLNESKS